MDKTSNTKSESVELDSSQADALFDHMQELMDALPAMEEKGERLAKARAAREVLRLERYRQGQENELCHIQDKFNEQVALEHEAKAAGDDEKEKSARSKVLNLGNQMAVRRGAEANARRKVEDALAQSNFSKIDDTHEATLEDEEFFALEKEIESFKSDYASTLAACQKIAGEGCED